MKLRWNWILVPPLVLSSLLLIVSQAAFLRGSLHRDIGLGRLDPALTLSNFVEIATDEYFTHAFSLSFGVSASATVLTLLMAFPMAYLIARMEGRWSMPLLAAVVASSFVTIVIKVLGLLLIFSSNGPLNKFLTGFGLTDGPVAIVGTLPGVVLGLIYYTFGFAVLLFYSLIVTIPRSLEEAAEIHGASRWQVMRQVVLPLCLPGLAAGTLMIFNVNMGGFSSTALIGAGKVLTVPIVVQRTVLLETSYGMGAAVAAVLLMVVLLINVAAVAVIARGRKGIVT
jgi:putative spermidine/putrescine transport system permease protein